MRVYAASSLMLMGSLAAAALCWTADRSFAQAPRPRLPNAPLSPAELREYGEAIYEYEGGGGSEGSAGGEGGGGGSEWVNRPPGALPYTVTVVPADGSVAAFYYIRQDHYLRLVPAGTDVSVLASYQTFGPFPVGANIMARVGFNYYFIPVCGTALAGARAVEVQINQPQHPFKLTCHG